MKKVLSILVALAVAMTMCMPMMAFAEDTTYSLTISGTKAGHTYDVYQIFTGEVVAEGTDNVAKLKKIKYGANYGGKTAGNAATEADFKAMDAATANTVKSGTAFKANVASADGNTVITGLPAGYYLVKETTATIPDGDAATAYIVQMVGDSTVAVKGDSPTVVKKVKDDTSTTWDKSADYDYGDDVPFQITVTLPDDETAYDKYDEYKVVIHDTIPNYTYNEDAVIKIGDKDVTDKFTITKNGDEITYTCNDVSEFANEGDQIVIEYTAKLDEDATVGNPGNPSTVKLEYSNNPDDATNPTGNTPEDMVNVFTYKVVINKVSAANEPLKGAGFTLYKKDGTSWVAVGTEQKGTDMTTFTWEGLDDGDYKLSETTTPEDFVTIADQEFTIAATHDATEILTLTGKTLFGDDDVTVASGKLETSIVNDSIRALPETGSFGTTMLYVVGGLIAIFAAMFIMARRKADSM